MTKEKLERWDGPALLAAFLLYLAVLLLFASCTTVPVEAQSKKKLPEWVPIKLERVIDGDTFVVLVDLGFDTLARRTCRLEGVDAPEVRGHEKKEGLRVTKAVKEFLRGKELRARIKKRRGGFGRDLCWIEVRENKKKAKWEDLTVFVKTTMKKVKE